jgi:predicted DNA-binding transcriptional regulator AlpA
VASNNPKRADPLAQVFYTSADVMRLLHWRSRSTLHVHLRKGDIPQPSRIGRSLLWPIGKFDAWLAKRMGVAS